MITNNNGETNEFDFQEGHNVKADNIKKLEEAGWTKESLELEIIRLYFKEGKSRLTLTDWLFSFGIWSHGTCRIKVQDTIREYNNKVKEQSVAECRSDLNNKIESLLENCRYDRDKIELLKLYSRINSLELQQLLLGNMDDKFVVKIIKDENGTGDKTNEETNTGL